MRIAHVSDIHIRNMKRHDEYREVFDNLYRKLDEIKPDIVVNTGDVAHTKTLISPEFVDMFSHHASEMAARAPYHIILGNHDLNLMNLSRQDAISPIVKSLADPRIFLYKKSGRFQFAPGWSFWVFSLADQDNYPKPADWLAHRNDVNIGLFHGSVTNCVTDSNWRMTHVEHDLSIFDGLDYCAMGDIHKQQSFAGGRFQYAGSLIQQNFGEEVDKGFLVWDIEDKNHFSVRHVTLEGGRKFYTVKLNDDLTVPDMIVKDDSRIRIWPPRKLTLVEQKAVERETKKLFKPYDVITLSEVSIDSQRAEIGKTSVSYENLRDIAAQEKLIRSWAEARGSVSSDVLTKMLDLNKRYQVHVDQKDDSTRNVRWRFNKIVFSNLFNYGADNSIDFSSLGGLIGIFAQNGAGKSNLVDVLLETLYDATTKGLSKNIFLINDNKEHAATLADITVNDQNYRIERTIERVRYGQRKFDETREWGKTVVNFSKVDEAGDGLSLDGTLRPETERSIRQVVGTYDDFLLTSLSAQSNPLDIIACKETRRKEILYRFLDLDVCEQKCLLARDEKKPHVKKLEELEELGLEDAVACHEEELKTLRASLALKEEEIRSSSQAIDACDADILRLASSRPDVPLIQASKLSIEEHIKEDEGELVRLRRDEEENRRAAKSSQALFDEIVTLYSSFDVDGHLQAKKTVEDARAFVAANEPLLVAKKHEAEISKKRVSLLDEVPCGDAFPECKFLVDAVFAKRRLPIVDLDIADIAINIEKNAEVVKALAHHAEELERYEMMMDKKRALANQRDVRTLQAENVCLRIASIEKSIQAFREKLILVDRAASSLQLIEEIEQETNILKTRRHQAADIVAAARHDVGELNKRIGSEEGLLIANSDKLKRLDDLKDEVTAYELYTEAMGKDGIPYEILTQKLPLINEEINKILSNAADFGVFIEHDPDEQSIRIYMQYGQYKSRLIELASGAEKMLASIAIRSALLSISNLPKPNIFIVDEGFGKLDAKNLENVQRMFDYLRTVFEHVIVISHLDLMKDVVDCVIEIGTDDEGYAHVAVGQP